MLAWIIFFFAIFQKLLFYCLICVGNRDDAIFYDSIMIPKTYIFLYYRDFLRDGISDVLCVGSLYIILTKGS